MRQWTKSYGVTIQMKATEQYFPVVLFIMLYKVVLTFKSVDVTTHMKPLRQSFSAILAQHCTNKKSNFSFIVNWG